MTQIESLPFLDSETKETQNDYIISSIQQRVNDFVIFNTCIKKSVIE